MERQRRRRLAEPLSNFAGRQPFVSFLHKQTKDIEAGFLRQRTERADHHLLFHSSIPIEISFPLSQLILIQRKNFNSRLVVCRHECRKLLCREAPGGSRFPSDAAGHCAPEVPQFGKARSVVQRIS